ncbi:hypothetical protein CTI12_AA272180 [Artemisia annua]|uniref:Uncharacterized protein n=1 Tax=Artemisia annua TaxID=35608 RepID=A0A2U1M1I3_ARTAN|nr:hypothetical protein CTI12_AA272180 [Artemisia annua]
MFAEIDQALDELDDVVAAGEGTEVYAIFAEPISFSLVPLVVVGEERFANLDVDGDDGEQRVRDVAVIPDDQCALVVGNEGCMPVVEGDVIKDKERRRLMADKKPKVAADKKPKDDADKNPKDDAK